jgi:hypothetical protein
MRAFTLLVAICLAVTACGSSTSSTSGSIDAAGGMVSDAAGADGAGTTPGMLALSGTAKEISASGQTPIAGVMLTAYNIADNSVLGTATSAADGTFSIAVNAGGQGINGYLKATTPGTGQNAYKDSYLYPPATLTANYSGVPVYVLKVSTYNLVNSSLFLNDNQSAQNGWIALLIQDATGAAVAGAKVTSTPMGQINYNASSLPSPTATATAADGIAYDTNITPGAVSVKATKAGTTFREHTIQVLPDVVTLTLITP